MREQWATGSVEEEARRLVEAAGEWLRTHPGDPGFGSATAGEGADAPEHDSDGVGAVTDRGGHGAEGPEVDSRSDAQAHEGAASTCQGCPWCRAKSALNTPAGVEALAGLADLLGAASESLRLFVQSRRQHHPGGTPEDGSDETEHEGEL